ncbi:class I SAM-dependent methyltransferase [Geomobilimonas luticola]|uniref:Methyltransferase domain-containing protein n=1 Tax=Geomobilimonas luticola TaxID=1114878 RepID=A0ABS5SCP9_9BACT|nr:class I SAM-dependent methyltransferase [Geomobilimonas luticola]MBT0653154.1 methyltransferase domain-containing protein [Geomobilimonas luticola]
MYTVREMYFGTREEFDYFQCLQCGCLQIAALPHDMSGFYPDGYYSFTAIDEASPGKKLRRFISRKRNEYALFRRGLVGRLLYALRRPVMPFESLHEVQGLKDKTVLDVGCGSGEFAHYLTELGIHIIGIDPFVRQDILYNNGLKILKKSLVDFSKETERLFDLIMFNHSFEHMPDPQETLHAASILLQHTGTIIIRIPTVSSYAWEHYRTNWVQLDAPRHLFLHSVESMRILAAHAGLVVSGIRYDSDELQFCGSEQYLKDIPLTSPHSYRICKESALFSKKDMERYKKQAAELNKQNRGDMAAFYLTKRP